MEAQQEKENRMMQLNTTGHNYSHDSAIDTDLQEWDTEMLNIDLVSFSYINLKFSKNFLADFIICCTFVKFRML